MAVKTKESGLGHSPESGGNRRLIVCLDGTWNNKDSSTSINSLFNLVADQGEDEKPQLAYYDEGVGTGVFDGITGGGFGFGLDANVREAYNWLIREYRDGDEIYIYGFSRGAYTARSLVGFIATCGLLRPGAPLTVAQLWEGYAILGRLREQKRRSLWERLNGKVRPPFRRISGLTLDEFGEEDPDREKRIQKRLSEQPLNETEELLVRHSRRVPIKFLGVFDTVGAMGWEALAIPGLRSKLSVMHNMYVTGIIQNCNHALAINENRSSFKHTPIHQYVSNGWNKKKKDAEVADWKKRVTQRWFVGAHSNIGGGYPDNRLSVEVLQWMIASSKSHGLSFRAEEKELKKVKGVDPVPSMWRDSYAEFTAPLWVHVLRAKRWYRQIDPVLDVKASTISMEDDPETEKKEFGNGYSRKFINEDLHESVVTFVGKDDSYAPPNLLEYAKRRGKKGDDTYKSLANRPEECDWLKEHKYEASERKKKPFLLRPTVARSALIVWSSLAAAGFVAIAGLINGYANVEPSIYFIASLAFLFVLVDWIEHRSNKKTALSPDDGRARAWADSVYWVRAVGVLLFFAGLAVAAWSMFANGVGLDGWAVPEESWQAMKDWWPLPVAASLGVLYADLRDRMRCRKREKESDAEGKKNGKKWNGKEFLKAVGLAAVSLLAAGILLALVGAWIGRTIPAIADLAEASKNSGQLSKEIRIQGLLLFLQIALLFLAKGFNWVGAPMGITRLGSITKLQYAFTPKKVDQVLQGWRNSLVCKWEEGKAKKEATKRMVRSVKEALHRDRIGFIPLFSLVFCLGLWMLCFVCKWEWLQAPVLGLPVWGWIVVLTAAADYLEDHLHFRFLDRFSDGETIGKGAVALCASATVIKMVGFFFSFFATIGIAIYLSWEVVTEHRYLDWRGVISGTLSIVAAVMAVAVVVLLVKTYVPKYWRKFWRWVKSLYARGE